MDLHCNPDEPAGYSTAVVRPRTDVPSPEPILSSANSASPTGTSDHNAPTTPRHGASFITDESKSTHSRGDSWASFSHELLYEFPISLGMAATMQEARDEPSAATRARKSSLPLPRSGATLDMAFFLKNTGPTSPGKTASKDKVNLKRMGLGIFKKRRDEDVSNQKAVYNSPPHDRAEPKVTLQGTKYLQIVPHSTPFKIEGLNISKSRDLTGPASPHHLTVPSQEDNPDAYGTETIDNWISTFTTQHLEEDLDSPTSKGISIVYNTPTDSSRRNSYLIPAAALPWLAGDDAINLTIDNDHITGNQCEGASQLCDALRSNPTSSPKDHNRSVSIHIPKFDLQATTSGNNALSEQLIEAGPGSPKERSDRRVVDVLSGQGMRRPLRDLDQGSTTSSQHLNESKALPQLPNEAIASADNNNLTTSSMLQVWRQRDAATNSVKAKYVPRSRRTTMIKSFSDSQHQDGSGAEDHTDDLKEPTPPSIARSSQIQTSAESTPSTTRGSMALSQVMPVAEQMPIPRGRHVNKPAPLVLRGRPSGKTRAVAVRAGDLEPMTVTGPPSAIPAPLTVSTPDSRNSENSTGETPVLLRPIQFKEPQRPAPKAPSPAPRTASLAPRGPSLQPTMLPAPNQTPPGAARLVSQQMSGNSLHQDSSAPTSSASSQGPSINFPKRSSSLISTTRNKSASAHLPAQNQTQSPTHHQHPTTKQPHPPRNISSRASNHTTTSRREKLTSRVEALERENKLLEAALMAVLKTGGALNKCPCGFFESRSSSTPPVSRIPKPSSSVSGSLLNPASGDGRSRSRRATRVQDGGMGSVDLGRVREGQGEGSDRDDGYLSVTAVDGSRASSSSVRVGGGRRRGSEASFESAGSGVSALEVYLGTRV